MAPCRTLNSMPSPTLICAMGWVPGAGLHPLQLMLSPR